MTPNAKGVLIDARNWAEMKDQLIAEIAAAGIVGFDLETEDSQRHEGLAQFMKVDDEGHKSKGKKLVFDVNRTVICGFSWYCDGSDRGYYLNLNHADIENRIPWSEARQILDAKNPEANWICHNAPFEITMMRACYGYELENVICTLQMAVSTYNADQYPTKEAIGKGFGGLTILLKQISEAFAVMDPSGDLDERQSELLGKVIGKTSTSSFSYNTYVDEMTYGYGLKKITESMFYHKQATFDETLNGKAHMGQITGEECRDYGFEDSYWTVRIFHRLLEMMSLQHPKLMDTFFEQENPMIYVFADIWLKGMRINLANVHKQRRIERAIFAGKLREMQALVRDQLPFPVEPCEGLANEAWYKDGKGEKYRRRIENWAKLDLTDDDITTAMSVGGAVSSGWAIEMGKPLSKGPNFTHYMMMRTLIYDLPGIKPIMSGGKVGSDKGVREKYIKKHPNHAPLVQLINEMADIETRMKLYLNPYLLLIDPEDEKIHPIVSSELNSRRMAMSMPNGMQLAKRGESTYVRGFYLPDEDDHVIISVDWSQIELVLIGDFSQDEGFREAYGQIPFNDLHWKAVGDMFETDDPKSLPNAKQLRTKVGKGANFNYWYSGALSTVGDAMGWSSDKMWDMTDKYRQTFAQAEEWRVDLIGEAREKGFVTLPDGHRRVRYEATYEWQHMWRERFGSTGDQGLINFGDLMVRRITSRAGNQIVNSMIQGSCATLAKRSILTAIRRIKEWGLRARFMMPIHDELVFSVHRDDVIPFLRMIRPAMCEHPEIIQHLCVDATASVGRTFEPYHPERAPFGQIELDEAPVLPGFVPEDLKDSRLDEEHVLKVIDYLFQEKANVALAA